MSIEIKITDPHLLPKEAVDHLIRYLSFNCIPDTIANGLPSQSVMKNPTPDSQESIVNSHTISEMIDRNKTLTKKATRKTKGNALQSSPTILDVKNIPERPPIAIIDDEQNVNTIPAPPQVNNATFDDVMRVVTQGIKDDKLKAVEVGELLKKHNLKSLQDLRIETSLIPAVLADIDHVISNAWLIGGAMHK